MRDNREHKRFRLPARHVRGKMIHATTVDIIDISRGGLSLRAAKRLNIGCGYIIKLEGKKKAISVKGIITWSRLSGIMPGGDGDAVLTYTGGMKFKDIPREEIPHLLDFINNHKEEREFALAG